MVAIYIFAGLGILVTLIAVCVLAAVVMPSVLAQFAVFKWQLQRVIDNKKITKIEKEHKKAEKHTNNKDNNTDNEELL